MKTVLLSGGCGFLGSEFAKVLRDDYEVIVLDLPDKIKENYKNILNFRGHGLDVTDEYEVRKLFKYIGKVDILVNSAAINPVPDGTSNEFENYSLEKWKRTLDVNLTGTFLMIKYCVPVMLKNTNTGFKGTIINVTSQLGLVSPNQSIYLDGYKKPMDYSVAASGIISMTRYLACYYGNKIKVNCLIPSMVRSNQSDKLIENIENLIPMGRLSEKNEFNGAIKFLCSDESSYMTGQTLVCDGGYTTW